MNLYLLLSVISLICLGLQFEPLATLSEWNRHALNQGEWWRILTGNFTHTNFPHLGMNLAGLWVISYIFKPSTKALLFALFTTSLGVGFAIFLSNMNIYVGLSGVLHGLFGYFAIQEVIQGRKSSWLLLIGLAAKVLWEQFAGPSASTAALIEARVAVEAHLAGAVTGVLFALIEKRQSLLDRR